MYVCIYVYISKNELKGLKVKTTSISHRLKLSTNVSKSMISSSMSYVKRNERSMCKLLLQIKFKFTN